ncbi:hypothetical protein J7J90_05090 [Candidatus Micrarchaeota archaeon]|nr:hypothetical protein [Candidatus Micrarchaeota archaeon]
MHRMFGRLNNNVENRKPSLSTIADVTFPPGIEDTLLSSKTDKKFNFDTVENILKIEKEEYPEDVIANNEQTFVANIMSFINSIKEKIITLFLILLPSHRKKGKFRKNKLGSKSRKALEQFKQLASLYAMYCSTEEELMAYEFAFDKIYYDLMTHSINNGYDEDYVVDKMTEFISVFEP